MACLIKDAALTSVLPCQLLLLWQSISDFVFQYPPLLPSSHCIFYAQMRSLIYSQNSQLATCTESSLTTRLCHVGKRRWSLAGQKSHNDNISCLLKSQGGRERESEIERVAFPLFSKSHLTFNLSFSKQLRLLIKNRWGAQAQHESNNKRWVSHHVAADPEPAEPVTKRRSAFKLKCIKPSEGKLR